MLERVAFSVVAPDKGREAYQWHRGYAGADGNLYPRTWQQYEALAKDGSLVSAVDANGDFRGLAYFTFDNGAWEVGGLMTAQYGGRGIGSVLARMALGHVLFDQSPLKHGHRVVMHVKGGNQDPVALIEKALKFKFAQTVRVHKDKVPGFLPNEGDYVVGSEYELEKPGSLVALAEWCDAWQGKLKDGTAAELQLRDGIALKDWAAAFRDMAKT